jgi:hypothetical protein
MENETQMDILIQVMRYKTSPMLKKRGRGRRRGRGREERRKTISSNVPEVVEAYTSCNSSRVGSDNTEKR